MVRFYACFSFVWGNLCDFDFFLGFLGPVAEIARNAEDHRFPGPGKAKNQSHQNSHTQMKGMCKILPETKHRAIWEISLGGDRFL